jgi:hypothetical protein
VERSGYPAGSINEVGKNYMGIILIIISILVLIGVLPTWPHNRNWGYYPRGGLGLILNNSDHPVTPWEDLKISRLRKITINSSERRDTQYE